MTEIPDFARAAVKIGNDTSSEVDFLVDAKAQLARALVENAAALPRGFVRAAMLFAWEVGDDYAEPIIAQIIQWKLRESRGISGRFVKALRSLAMEEQKELALLASKKE